MDLAHAAAAAQAAGAVQLWEALVCGLVLGVMFIAGFFILKEPAKRTNDDSQVILQRMASVLVACIASPALLAWWLGQRGALSYGVAFVQWIGFRTHGLLAAVALPLLLTVILFAGPLTLSYFDEELPFQQFFSFRKDVVDAITSMTGVRNYLVAPLTEELIFRGCIVPGLFLSGLSNTAIVFLCPLFFGVGTPPAIRQDTTLNLTPCEAHLHHIRDLYKKASLLGKRDNILGDAIARASTHSIAWTQLAGALSLAT